MTAINTADILTQNDWTSVWRGVKVHKAADDLIAIAQIIWETKPTWILETGSYEGGSARFLADVSNANVISLDKKMPVLPEHPRVTYVETDSATWQGSLPRRGRWMVLLDSDHRKAHVLKELERYASWVTPGCFLIVEDTFLDGENIVDLGDEGGPGQALNEWLPSHPEFVVERSRERLLTTNPAGYLRRV